MTDSMGNDLGAPGIVDRSTFQKELDALRIREKAHTREGDAIATARRRLPMVQVDSTTPLAGARGQVTLLDAFEGRRMLIAYYFMWHTGAPAAKQCVLGPGLARHPLGWTPGRDDAHCLPPATRIQRLRDVLDHAPWCRGDG